MTTSTKTERCLLQLKIELAFSQPAIWRRVLVLSTITLPRLHDVIQAAMGWYDDHLHEFEIAGRRYSIETQDYGFRPPVLSTSRVRLLKALEGKRTFSYLYDFGDSWQHKIKLEKTLPWQDGAAPVCVGGANASPPEDIGGVGGYFNFIDAISDPSHPDHADMCEYFGADFDPTHFDVAEVNQRLLSLVA